MIATQFACPDKLQQILQPETSKSLCISGEEISVEI